MKKTSYPGEGKHRKQIERAVISGSKRDWILKNIVPQYGVETQRGIASIVDQAIVSATNFLTGAIIARTCSVEVFGIYMLGFSIILFLLGMQDSLIVSPYTTYSPRLKGSDAARYAGSTLIHQFSYSAFAILFSGIVCALLAFGIGPQELTPVAYTLSIVITFILLREYARRFCLIHLQIKVAIFIDLSVAITQLVGLFLLLNFGILTPKNSYLVIGFACGLISLSWLAWTRKTFILELNRSVSDLAKNYSLGKWLFAGSLLYMLGNQVYPWILTGSHGSEAVGIFSACIGIIALINPFLKGIENYLGPKMSHAYVQGVKELSRIVIKATLYLGLIIGIVCIVLFFCGDFFVMFIYSEKYAGNGFIVSILSLSTFFIGITIPAGYALRAMERTDINFKCNFIQLIVTVTLGLWLTKVYGPLGVAFALLLGRLTICIVTYLYYLQHTRQILLEMNNLKA